VRFAPGSVLVTEPPARGPLTVAAARSHSGRLIVAFDGVGDRGAAEDLRGTLLMLDSAQIPSSPDPDEFYDHELIGLGVVTAAGAQVGVVADVLHHGQDLLVVRRDVPPSAAPPGARAGAETLVPFVGAIVTDVDVPAGRLVIDPPPGLLDPDEANEA